MILCFEDWEFEYGYVCHGRVVYVLRVSFQLESLGVLVRHRQICWDVPFLHSQRLVFSFSFQPFVNFQAFFSPGFIKWIFSLDFLKEGILRITPPENDKESPSKWTVGRWRFLWKWPPDQATFIHSFSEVFHFLCWCCCVAHGKAWEELADSLLEMKQRNSTR